MERSRPLVSALLLVSLATACAYSETVDRPRGSTADPAPPQPTFTPFDPTAAPIVPTGAGGSVGPPPAGAGGGTGGSAGAPADCAGHPSMMPPPSMRPTLPLALGPTVRAGRAPRPISGGTLLVTRDGGLAVAADSDRDRVYVVDLVTRTVRFDVALETGDEPGRVVEDGARRVHVALRGGGAVAVIDMASGQLVSRRGVCPAPRGLAYQADADLIHVACADGRVRSVAAGSGALVRSISLRDARDLRDIVVMKDGKLLVTTFRRADAIVLDRAGELVEQARPLTTPRKSFTGVQMMSAAVAWRLAPMPGGGAVMLHERGVDDDVNAVAGGYGVGRGCGSIVESSLTTIRADGFMAMSSSGGIADVSLAVDVAASPGGQEVAVAVPGNAMAGAAPQVVILDVATATSPGSECTFARGATGAPIAGNGQVVAVAYTSDGAIAWQSREPAALGFSDGSMKITLSASSVADTGHALFHGNAGGGLACASCHPEGGEDGRVWRFSCLGPRRTQSLRGGLSDTAPFHWAGDMTDFSKLVDEVFVGRMSGPILADDKKTALLGWLDTIPLLPAAVSSEASVRGGALFHDPAVACATCHAGGRLTTNATVDVGTGLLAQVPSLRGVAWRAPFIHTGCAPTLRDRFGACGGGDKHGHTSQLAPSQLDDLAAYLETL